MNLTLRPALVLFLLLSLLTGVLYPFAVTGLAQALFHQKANGSILNAPDGKTLGSSLIGQDFSDPKYFWGRLSATSPVPYSAYNAGAHTGSSGSNLAPTNPDLVKTAQARVKALAAADASAGYVRPAGQTVPVDLVTSSASGLD